MDLLCGPCHAPIAARTRVTTDAISLDGLPQAPPPIENVEMARATAPIVF